LVIGVYDLPKKNLLFEQPQRMAMVEECLHEYVRDNRARVQGYSGLTVEFARRIGAKHMVRGLRNSVDFDYELQLSQTNRWLAPDVETVYLFANTPHSFLSSTLVREITTLNGDVTALVPPCVSSALQAKAGER
jgi:pantetheine-phosphate adenylyltransferase